MTDCFIYQITRQSEVWEKGSFMLRNTFKLLSISTLGILLVGCKVGAPLNQSVMISHKPTVNQSAKRVSVHAGISAYHNNMLIVGRHENRST